MKRYLLAVVAVLGLGSLGGCYADIGPYAYGPDYGYRYEYAAPVYTTPVYIAPVYTAPAYRPTPRVYAAPARPYYRAPIAPARYRTF